MKRVERGGAGGRGIKKTEPGARSGRGRGSASGATSGEPVLGGWDLSLTKKGSSYTEQKSPIMRKGKGILSHLRTKERRKKRSMAVMVTSFRQVGGQNSTTRGPGLEQLDEKKKKKKQGYF